MATTSTMPWYSNNQSRGSNASTGNHHHRPETTTCPPTNFPENFKEFFMALSEDPDDQPSMLEDKLIPRKDGDSGYGVIVSSSSSSSSNSSHGKSHCPTTSTTNHNNSSSLSNLAKQRWQKRAFQRRSSEIEVRLNGTSHGHGCEAKSSPTPSRRRSSSIAVARPTPDLHRFLQAEAGPWGHLSPSARSPTRTPTLSPAMPTTPHLSPGGTPSPTSPAAPASRLPPQPKHRGRTSSMPAVPRHRPMLADTRRGAVGGNNGIAGNGDDETEDGVEYYRVRSFSITANGVFNLGDALKSRRSRSINSVTSSNTSCSSVRDIKDPRLLNSASQLSEMENGEPNEPSAAYKVGMLGASGVGKTALTAQFCTSEYICAYDASLEVRITHFLPAQTEAFCSTYNPDVFVIVYSVVDRSSFKHAEQTLMYLWNNNYMASRGVILVGNMADLERKREVSTITGRRLATTFNCKFIETSSGIAHHVDELLVGIIAQIKLNPQRNKDQSSRRRRHKHSHKKILKSILGGFHRKTKSCENLFTI
ncbi:uncharacterized protein LOC106645217 [Copidosoma floridanum]|uniref:uncharacterized protein LOC106645217 n=1 Tax=Copidosoma floridanum TaxID=29053 RepID=UPI0006C99A54|nr:uncharacterized protein LOC106645217 [Copidosoma floridanum]